MIKAMLLGAVLALAGCQCGATYATTLHRYSDGDVRCYYTDAVQPLFTNLVQPVVSCVVVGVVD